MLLKKNSQRLLVYHLPQRRIQSEGAIAKNRTEIPRQPALYGDPGSFTPGLPGDGCNRGPGFLKGLVGQPVCDAAIDFVADGKVVYKFEQAISQPGMLKGDSPCRGDRIDSRR